MTDDPLPSTGRVAVALADFAQMVRFFSRLPVPRLSGADDPAAMPVFARAIVFLPVAALVIASPVAGVLVVMGSTALPALAVAGLALGAGLLATGALHEDGLADTADGFGGGATRERKLEIMRDSRIGSYGAAALATVLLTRAGLLAGLLAAAGPLAAAAALLAGASLSRTIAVSLMAALPPARADGTGHAAGRLPAGAALAGLGLAGLVVLALAGPAVGWTEAAAGTLAAGLAGAAMARAAQRQIGGQTGDVVGATQQVTEVAFLTGLALV